jgi:hypothetical protein
MAKKVLEQHLSTYPGLHTLIKSQDKIVKEEY